MSDYQIRITKQAQKDIGKLTPKLRKKLKTILIEVIAQRPYEGKKLLGDLAGNYSYRLSYQDRIVYSVDEENRIIYIKRARSHYGE
ncbi:type II toxin-antitoxin system mRNA interferase toxin, RelE/StbE family [Candidatus Leptofilum sp.]|uniref:type II toxin-antitoxin system mRNA interferase toxin, RelE/StbE family n=1 Tax=Candidatus Leptofilum sp. TaxID=3241576 RepID=UPI003B5B5D4A